jgi:hypothetical protein
MVTAAGTAVQGLLQFRFLTMRITDGTGMGLLVETSQIQSGQDPGTTIDAGKELTIQAF